MFYVHAQSWLHRERVPSRRGRKISSRQLSLERLEDRLVLSTTWIEQGPGPILGAFNAVIPNQNNPEDGAVAALATDPSNADIVYAATVNGGVWKTTNATSLDPTWTPLTDTALPFLSTNAIALSPVDPNTIFVGTGSTSSDASQGSAGFGIAKSTDGGQTWTIGSGSLLANRRIRSVVATPLDAGNVVLVCTLTGGGGVYRSADGGATYTRISGSAGSGLPDAGVGALVEDPSAPARIYAAVPGGLTGPGLGGVYKSEDGGLTWTQMNTGLAGFNTAIRAKLAIHNDPSHDVVYAMFIDQSGGLGGISYSANMGASWQALAAPSPTIYPGFQGSVHGAIAADPVDPSVIFVSGDRQDSPFPNSLGATSFTGITFRGTISGSTVTWESVDWNGAHGTSPHADSRSLVFDANGNLLRGDDGGVYRLDNPDNATTRQWVSLNGNLRATEIHSVAFDPVSGVIFDGTQDNGTDVQFAPGGFTFGEFLGGDGGVVGVDAKTSAHPGISIRYTSFQFFGFFNRSMWDANNNFLGLTQVGLNIVAGPGKGQNLLAFDPNIQFYQPFVLNSADPTRMLIGTAQLYESFNQGDSLTDLGGFNGSFVGNGLYGQPMVYGGMSGGKANPDVLYAGIGSQILFRQSMGALTNLPSYPGGTVSTIAENPRDYKNIYVVDVNNQVWASFNKGGSFTNVTGNLGALSPQIDTLVLVSPTPDGSNDMLVAGGLGGVFALKNPASSSTPVWARLGINFPNVLVQDLHFDQSNDLLIAGTLGRGAWTLQDPTGTGSSIAAGIANSVSLASSIPNLTSLGLPVLEQLMTHENDGGGSLDVSTALGAFATAPTSTRTTQENAAVTESVFSQVAHHLGQSRHASGVNRLFDTFASDDALL
jgi:hypothetical protein